MAATTKPTTGAEYRPCGPCTLCCKVVSSEPSPVEGEWCDHCDPRGGCKIYEAREEIAPGCITFNCVWKVGGEKFTMPAELRPDRSKCVVTGPAAAATAKTRHFHVFVDPDRPQAWLAPNFRAWMEPIMEAGAGFIVHAGGYHFPVGPTMAEWVEIWERDPAGILPAFGIKMAGDYKQIELHPSGERREKEIRI